MVDDFIPVKDNDEPCFSRNKGKELWVLILEKAWAKLHKSYDRICYGTPFYTFRDLTGAPTYQYNLTDEGIFQ